MKSLSDISNVIDNQERRVQICDKNEPLLQDNDNRFVLFPIQHDDIWSTYKDNIKHFWLCDTIGKADCLSLLGKAERMPIEKILSFWCNYSEQEMIFQMNNDIQVPEARCFLGFQIYNQINHKELFGRLMRAASYWPVSRRKYDIVKAIFDRETFGGRLVAYSAMESIGVSSLRVVRRLLERHGSLTAELVKFIDLVLRDKDDYAAFGGLLQRHCVYKPTAAKTHQIVRAAVQAEIEFLRDVFADDDASDGVSALVQAQGNRVCKLFQHEPIFHCAANPFD